VTEGSSAHAVMTHRRDVACLPLLAHAGRRSRVWWSAGLALPVVAYLPLLALASSKLGRFVGDLNATRAGRSLPLPSLFDFPGSLLAARRSRVDRLRRARRCALAT